MNRLSSFVCFCSILISIYSESVPAQSESRLSAALTRGVQEIASFKSICPAAQALSALALRAPQGAGEERCSPKLDPVVESSLIKSSNTAHEIQSAKLVIGPQIFLLLHFRHTSGVSVNNLKAVIEAGINGGSDGASSSSGRNPGTSWKTGTFGGETKATILRLSEKLEVWILLNKDGTTTDQIFFADDTNFPLID